MELKWNQHTTKTVKTAENLKKLVELLQERGELTKLEVENELGVGTSNAYRTVELLVDYGIGARGRKGVASIARLSAEAARIESFLNALSAYIARWKGKETRSSRANAAKQSKKYSKTSPGIHLMADDSVRHDVKYATTLLPPRDPLIEALFGAANRGIAETT